MPATYEPIATTVLGSGTSTITFSSITNTYTDLRLVTNILTTGFDTELRFNSDSNTNYSWTFLRGTGSAVSTARVTNQPRIYLAFDVSTSQPNFHIVDIFSYAGSTFKTALIETSADSSGSGNVERRVGIWRSTSAISRIDLIHGSTFLPGTTATLYGIKAA